MIPLLTFDIEDALAIAPVAGVDEAGRGAWAGPVVAAAVAFDRSRPCPDGIDDSKRLKPDERERLYDEIHQVADVGLGIADCRRVDRDNVLAATLWAMREAVAALSRSPSVVIVDGKSAPSLDVRVETVVRGDSLSLSIAAASIIAKVTRDRMMVVLARELGGYGFEKHKGYGTREHVAAIERLGVCREHRRSFRPIALMLAQSAPVDASLTIS